MCICDLCVQKKIYKKSAEKVKSIKSYFFIDLQSTNLIKIKICSILQLKIVKICYTVQFRSRSVWSVM